MVESFSLFFSYTMTPRGWSQSLECRKKCDVIKEEKKKRYGKDDGPSQFGGVAGFFVFSH